MAKVRKHQSIMDLALQECGDITALFELAIINGIGITDIIDPGTDLKAPSVYNKKAIQFYTERSVVPACLDDEAALAPGGIGYMGININFKVS